VAKSVDVYRRAWGGSGQRDGKLELVFALTTDFADGKSQDTATATATAYAGTDFGKF
jgi:hypothetical protein